MQFHEVPFYVPFFILVLSSLTSGFNLVGPFHSRKNVLHPATVSLFQSRLHLLHHSFLFFIAPIRRLHRGQFVACFENPPSFESGKLLHSCNSLPCPWRLVGVNIFLDALKRR